MKVQLNYSYLSDWTGSNFAAFKAGNIETIIVINIEDKEIKKIEYGLISEGIVLRKYISSGNKLISNILLKNCLKFSTYIEKITPNKFPKIVSDVPIITPTKKKILPKELF